MNYLTISQKTAFEKFKKLKVGAAFMKMGTGKTLLSIELLKFNAGKFDTALIITPNQTKKEFENELKKWGYNGKTIITTYEAISMSKSSYLDLLEKVKGKKLFVIADESIFIKNSNTKRYSRIIELTKDAEYKLILNGTPLTKNEWDLYNQMNFLSPKIFNMSEAEFNDTFFDKITYKKRDEAEKTFYKFSEVNASYLKKIIQNYVFEVDLNFEKDETEEHIIVESSAETYERYKEQKNMVLECIESRSNNLLAELQKINQTAATCETKQKRVAEYIKDKQVIVYCQFKKEAEQIIKNTKCFYIDGDVNVKDRERIINDFKQSKIPLVMTYGVGSFGLNLQFCNEIVFCSLTFDYAKVEQAKYRIKRIGQEQNIKYTYFKTNLGIDKIIGQNLERKKDLHDLINFELDKIKNEI